LPRIPTYNNMSLT